MGMVSKLYCRHVRDCAPCQDEYANRFYLILKFFEPKSEMLQCLKTGYGNHAADCLFLIGADDAADRISRMFRLCRRRKVVCSVLVSASHHWESYMFFGVMAVDGFIFLAELLSGRGLRFVDGVLSGRLTEIR